MERVYAIIPALGGTDRLPRRDLKEIKGDPLVGIAVSQALNSERISEVFVNSNDDEVLDVAADYGADVRERPERFAQRDRFMEVDRLLAWQVEQLESEGHDVDAVVLLYPTSPLRTITAIDDTIAKVTEGSFDSALTLYEDNRYLWKKEGDGFKPVNYDPQKRGPHHIEEWNQWVENKAVYAMTRDVLIKKVCRLGGNVGCVEMPTHRSISIDSPVDFELASFITEVDGASW